MLPLLMLQPGLLWHRCSRSCPAAVLLLLLPTSALRCAREAGCCCRILLLQPMR